MENVKENTGTVRGVNGNMVSVEFEGRVKQNEVAYVRQGALCLKSEVVRIRGNRADLQVFDSTRGVMAGDGVEFTGDLLSVELGPGLLGNVYDGLQNPLYTMSERHGSFIEKGITLPALAENAMWTFVPIRKAGDRVERGDAIGTVAQTVSTILPICAPESMSACASAAFSKGNLAWMTGFTLPADNVAGIAARIFTVGNQTTGNFAPLGAA